MIRIRPGRSWRLNPGYVGELRALTPPRARAFTGGGILDVLGIEVDGVDIAAGVGEAEVLVAADELLSSLRRIAEGSPAAQATVGRGPTELVLEARGADVLLALVSLAPPARTLASGLLLDGARLWAAAASAARALAEDVIAVAPLLSESPLLRRLQKAGARPRQHAAAPWPHQDGRAFLARGGYGGVRCEVRVSEDAAARLAARADVPHAPLAPLLGAGAVALRFGTAPALSWEAPAYLALRNLVRDAAALVQAWEAGDPHFTLRFGGSELSCDLTRDEVRAPGWRAAVTAPPAALAVALARAARAYAEKALRLVPGRRAQDDPLRDLRSSASRLAEHCTELASGDLRRAPETVAAPPPHKAPRPHPPPLSAGRIRRLVYREAWRVEAKERPVEIWLLPGSVVSLGLREAVGRDPASGSAVFSEACQWSARAHAGDDLLLSSSSALLRLDPLTGAIRWRRRMAAAAELCPVPGGVALPSNGGLERVSDGGALSWRARLASGPPDEVVYADGVLACAGRALLCAVDAADGRTLWKRRARVVAMATAPGKLIAILRSPRHQALLVAIEPHDGAVLWERPLPGGCDGSLTLWADAALVVSGDRQRTVSGARLTDGTLRFSAALPFGGPAVLAGDDADDQRRVLVATGRGGAAARLDERGRVAWRHEADGDAQPEAALLQRGVLLLHRGGVILCDSARGALLAQLSSRPAKLTALASDMTAALLDEAGTLSLHKLATHLSVV